MRSSFEWQKKWVGEYIYSNRVAYQSIVLFGVGSWEKQENCWCGNGKESVSSREMVSGCLGSDVDGFLIVFVYCALRTSIFSLQFMLPMSLRFSKTAFQPKRGLKGERYASFGFL
jgi:hypothetical protein